MIFNRVLLLGSLMVLAGGFSTAAQAVSHPGSDAFIQRASTEFGLDAAQVSEWLSEAKFQQSIVDAMTRPAEGKPWHEYRKIFLTGTRIRDGIGFWRENRALIQSAADRFGVDPQIIVAIIGVETMYGRITGSYRVLDALATLGFYYPSELKRDRSAFFSSELMHFIKLSSEEGLPLTEVTGSYAGAMGMGQFIPSSYRAYAVDFDEDGKRDLWRSTADAVGSVANYLHKHGWQAGERVTDRTRALPGADVAMAAKRDYKPKMSLAELSGKGFEPLSEIDPSKPASVIQLDEADGHSYWLTFDNFYVITRYNRSPMYAMAVLQLSEEISRGMQGP